MQLQRFQQISESHCGPAVIQMLLNAVDVSTTQEAITRAAGAEETIEEKGTRIDQLARAATIIAPRHIFWYKYYSSIEDIEYVLQRGYGVGVEWQGLFYDTIEEQEEEEDYGESGHYSIISFLDQELEQLILVDPYKDFARQNRILPIEMFVRRWWDKNDIYDPVLGKTRTVIDEQLLFFVTPATELFPEERGFKQFNSVRASGVGSLGW